MICKKDKEILKRFSKGVSNDKENEYVYSLFVNNEDNNEFENHLKKEFDEYLIENADESHDLNYLIDRIHHVINKTELAKKDTVVKKIYKWYSVAAAVVLIPLLIAGGIWVSNQGKNNKIIAEAPVTSTLYAPLGSRISFTLPDGTQGWLNSGSTIKYNLPFSNNREIALEGEVWFDVAHDINHPFEITSGSSKVKVVGTKFNLSAYPDEKYLELVLEEGKVEFMNPGLSKNIEIIPNERLVLSEKAINISKTDATKYSAWKEGKLVFRGDTMDEVARRISRWYNVDVEIVDKELNNYSFRGIFSDDSLEEVVKYICMTSPIRYKIIDRKQLDDGTVQKKIVKLFKKKI